MSAADRLDEIAARLADPMVTYKENATEDAPALVTALRAVLDLHPAVDPDVSVDYYREPDYCPTCREYYPCPTVRAIEAALGEAS